MNCTVWLHEQYHIWDIMFCLNSENVAEVPQLVTSLTSSNLLMHGHLPSVNVTGHFQPVPFPLPWNPRQQVLISVALVFLTERNTVYNRPTLWYYNMMGGGVSSPVGLYGILHLRNRPFCAVHFMVFKKSPVFNIQGIGSLSRCSLFFLILIHLLPPSLILSSSLPFFHLLF